MTGPFNDPYDKLEYMNGRRQIYQPKPSELITNKGTVLTFLGTAKELQEVVREHKRQIPSVVVARPMRLWFEPLRCYADRRCLDFGNGARIRRLRKSTPMTLEISSSDGKIAIVELLSGRWILKSHHGFARRAGKKISGFRALGHGPDTGESSR